MALVPPQHPGAHGPKGQSRPGFEGESDKDRMTPKKDVKHRIVIVDDSPMLAVQLGEYIRACLEDTEVLVFYDGVSAWKELTQTDPNVLITDMQRFDGMSGWDMLPLLAERKIKYPILLITGYSEKNDPADGKTLWDVHDLLRSACSNLNVTVLPKPFPLVSLLKALESTLPE